METLPNPEQTIKDPNPPKRSRFSKVVLATVFLVSLILIGGLFWWVIKSRDPASNSQSSTSQTEEKEVSSEVNAPAIALDPNKPPLTIKNIGVNIDYYDPKTGKAGDFVFTKSKLQFDSLFMGYGFVIPGSSASSGKEKANPQPTYILPLGTPVRSIVDGMVANMPTLWSGDISIQVTTDGKLQRWVYEVEHVQNPKVKVGDKVAAGQIIGEVSNFDKGAPPGFGAVEIGLLKGGNPPEHICPYAYLDPSVKADLETKITALQKSWADYRGDSSLYNEADYVSAGCLTSESIEG